MTQTIKTINEGAEFFAIAGAHLLVSVEEFFQPGMEGLIPGIICDDARGVTKLIIEFHDGL